MTEAMRGDRDLIVWQTAMQLVPLVYGVVKKLRAAERYALRDQIRRLNRKHACALPSPISRLPTVLPAPVARLFVLSGAQPPHDSPTL